MSNLESILTNALLWFRFVGIIVIVIVAMGVLIAAAAHDKLSPGKILAVAGSGVLAGVLFWFLPTVIINARDDVSVFIPDTPVGFR